jgi:MFS family permease
MPVHSPPCFRPPSPNRRLRRHTFSLTRGNARHSAAGVIVAEERSPGVLSRQLVLSLYLPAAMLALGESLVTPIIPLFTKQFGVGFATASLVFVMMNVGGLVAAFSTGYLMDTMGRRPVLLSAPLLMAVGSLMTPFSGSFTALLGWRFVVGAAHQAWQQARLAIITDTVHYGQRARQLQWMMGVSRAGQLFGPSVGGLSAAAFGLWVPFVSLAGLVCASIIPSYTLIEETAPGRRGRLDDAEVALAKQGWKPLLAYICTVQMLTFFVIQFCATLCRGGQERGTLNLYAAYAFDMGPERLGLLNTVAMVFGLPVPFLTGYLMDRFGRRWVIVPGFTVYALSIILMSLTAFYSLPVTFFLVTYVLVLATQGPIGGVMQVLGSDLAPPFARGRFFAIWRPIAQLGATVTPAIFASIAQHAGYGYGFLYLAGCALVVALGVGTVLGDTLAQQDRTDAEWGAEHAG